MSSTRSLRIGPLNFLCATGPEFPSLEPTGLYASFFDTEPSGLSEGSLVTTSVIIDSGETAGPDRPADFEAGGHWKFWRDEEELVFATGYGERTKPERLCRVTSDLRCVRLWVHPRALKAKPLPAHIAFPLSYPLDQILAWGLLSRMGGLLLHAAVAERKDGTAILLAGRSGAGKSTLSALCADAGWSILNDDRALVYFRDDRVLVAGTPWHGSGRYAVPRTVPLKGILFLNQAGENRLETLDRASLLTELLQVTSLPLFLDEWATPVFAALNSLAASVPMQRFHFVRDSSAVERLAAERM